MDPDAHAAALALAAGAGKAHTDPLSQAYATAAAALLDSRPSAEEEVRTQFRAAHAAMEGGCRARAEAALAFCLRRDERDFERACQEAQLVEQAWPASGVAKCCRALTHYAKSARRAAVAAQRANLLFRAERAAYAGTQLSPRSLQCAHVRASLLFTLAGLKVATV